MDTNQPDSHLSNSPDSPRKVWYSVGKLALTFVAGVLAVLIVQYLSHGNPVHLSPDMFISLVFTLAIGAASVILALLAINYGRVSEKVITERADKSIEIQMNLFQKSLDLQTQLFDKTMSTLETIGRSTGVTEQRLGDILSLYQNPTFLKQVAGKAVQETTAELGKSGKEGVTEPQSEEQLAERLTKNIVRELSTRLEGLERAVQSTSTRLLPSGAPSPPEIPGAVTASAEEDRLTSEARLRALKRLSAVGSALAKIPEVKLLPKDASLTLWDFLLAYKGKTMAIDMRAGPIGKYLENYDRSIKFLSSYPVDCLIFVSFGSVLQPAMDEFERRSELFGGKIRVVAVTEEGDIQNDILGVLESVAGKLPSPN